MTLERDADPQQFADRATGCLLGGAVGDALGASVEFLGIDEIRARFGSAGIGELPRPGYFTDDTQMTLFSAEGLIRASVRSRTKGICSPPAVVYRAYLRWLHTQGDLWPWPSDADADVLGRPKTSQPDGWLIHDRRLHHRMAPGATCLSALRSGAMGNLERRINDSKGCGGVMRVAPAGIVSSGRGPDAAYGLGCKLAAITHGHDDGIYPAGAFAVMVAELVRGADLVEATARATDLASGNVRALLDKAAAIAPRLPEPELLIGGLGEGWTGDEALALAVACALSAPDDFEEAVTRAVNHSGDSDSTGAICGNLMGAALGTDGVPARWLEGLFARDLVDQVAADLVLECTNPPAEPGFGDAPPWWSVRYPGW